MVVGGGPSVVVGGGPSVVVEGGPSVVVEVVSEVEVAVDDSELGEVWDVSDVGDASEVWVADEDSPGLGVVVPRVV